MTEQPLLEVQALRVEYAGAAPVVNDVSFSVASGQCLGVIGESGAGKSQTFLAMLGLLTSRARISGSARLAGEELLSPAVETLRGREVGMIFQDPLSSLTPHLRIGDQIAEPLVVHQGKSWADARACAAQLLDRVRMSDVPRRLRQYPHELSGGMRQRAMIAMALACGPKLLIADEPTTALDVSVQAQILALLRELLAESQVGLVLVTHDMGVIATLADEVMVMRSGSVVERGSAAQVLQAPREPYTQALRAATPSLDDAGPMASGASTKEPPLVVRGLGVRYRMPEAWWRARRELVAVENVSFDVAPGEALGIVGESGCGKSTLARALLKLGPISAGEVAWLGQPMQRASKESLRQLRAGMQMVFQDPFASLDPAMTVGECVEEPLRALRPDMDAAARAGRVLAVLEQVGLDPGYVGRRSHSLSGGQCQRVAIARAMVLSPRLLVCDESVSALDVSIQAQILDLLADIKRREGTSLVFVSHNLAVVRRLCERVLVMYLGRVVESGPTDAVFRSPAHPYTRLLLEAAPRLEPATERARLAGLASNGETPSAVDRPTGCGFHSRCPAARPDCARRSPEPEWIDDSRQVACLRWRDLQN